MARYELGESRVRRALERTWWPVARAADVGDPVEAELLERKLVVYRGTDGEARVAGNRCPHRGAGLALGEVVENAIACAYHGWQWDGSSGRCVHVPSLDDQARISRTARLRTYPVEERWGLVWTCLHEDPVGSVPEPDWLMGVDWVYGVGISDVATNVLFAQENFRDVAHFAVVHRRTIPVATPVVERLNPERDGYEIRLDRWIDPGAAPPPTWLMTAGFASSYSAGFANRYHAMVPNLVSYRAEYGSAGTLYLLNCPCPLSLEATRVFYVRGVSGSKPDMSDLLDSEAKIYAEDKPIVSSIEPRRLGQPLDQCNTLADAYTLAFRRAFADYVNEYGTLDDEAAFVPDAARVDA